MKTRLRFVVERLIAEPDDFEEVVGYAKCKEAFSYFLDRIGADVATLDEAGEDRLTKGWRLSDIEPAGERVLAEFRLTIDAAAFHDA